MQPVHLGSHNELGLSFKLPSIKPFHIIFYDVNSLVMFKEAETLAKKKELIYKRLSDEKQVSKEIKLQRGMKIKLIKSIFFMVN